MCSPFSLVYYIINMKKFHLTLIAISSFLWATSQTSISGSLINNTTWTPDGNPYVVTGTLLVPQSVELILEPGVVVKFELGAGIQVEGKLSAIGTEQDSIVFTSNLEPPVDDAWTGIRVIGTSNPMGDQYQVAMNYCKGMYATAFVDLDLAYHGPYIFRNCYFAHNRKVNNDGGAPYTWFDSCKFVSNFDALTTCQFDSRVSHSYFYNNMNGVEGVGIVDSCYFSGHVEVACSPYGSMTGCTVKNNAVGVSCYFNSVNNNFVNNIVKDNETGVEIKSYFNGFITFTGNTICNNSEYNIRMATLVANDADLSNNCWCETDSAAIQATIYDGLNNQSYGVVDFMPIGTDCPQNSLGIHDFSQDEIATQYEIYPNPFTNSVSIRSIQGEDFRVEVFDVANRKIVDQKCDGSVLTFNTGAFTEGVYFYKIYTPGYQIVSGKLIKVL